MKYVDAFAIAKLAVRDLKQCGMEFRSGTPRHVALAAVQFEKEDEIKRAMKDAINACRISQRWDGSIA